MKSITPFLLAFVALCLLFPSSAFACACCADAGYYSIGTKKLSGFELGELNKIRFGAANLFMTEADDILGINPIGESFTLNGLLEGKIWKMNFTDETGKTGMLRLTAPTSMVAFAADIHDRPDDDAPASEPRLYKEWRFKSKVESGTGIFQKGVAPAAVTEYFLVLQGRGNVCAQAENFTDWRLEITGKNARYAFFGKLKAVRK